VKTGVACGDKRTNIFRLITIIQHYSARQSQRITQETLPAAK